MAYDWPLSKSEKQRRLIQLDDATIRSYEEELAQVTRIQGTFRASSDHAQGVFKAHRRRRTMSNYDRRKKSVVHRQRKSFACCTLSCADPNWTPADEVAREKQTEPRPMDQEVKTQKSLEALEASPIPLGQSQSSCPGSATLPRANIPGSVLKPSLKGTRAMKVTQGDGLSDLRPVQELQDAESAITCVIFGQENLHKSYVLLVTASENGVAVIYRCYRTKMEIAMLPEWDMPKDSPPDHSNITVHSRLVGHSGAITSIFFNILEDELVTTSIDKSICFWSVDAGEMIRKFTDSSPVHIAAFLPFNPEVLAAASSNAMLRLMNVNNGRIQQTLKFETEASALSFDDTGLFLFAGTKNGSIHVLEVSKSSTLQFKFKMQVGRNGEEFGVTCINIVPTDTRPPPCLLVNTCDSSITIIDCTYDPPTGFLTNLTVRHCIKVAQSFMPWKCCFSPSGGGFLISGSEDKDVYVYSLAQGAEGKCGSLRHHQAPAVAVACNLQDTLLASADALGRVVLWRRMDFCHIQE
eukprot:gnl/MRDRNA2_/MRDRNA2_120859_c0_seq1.p1 gnl/MRDRNA2_/MRDRNA2_120859_c0~~gnl/MRDRNA2_/MRDRNA2_120859_c0_seq1.p1  ORF type:complete len:523 (+),score=83.90 gnl/MRDRNA2_/MRDRNA2_120859_c0_seq1:44-1612(+)